MVMPNVYPALALAPQTASYIASDSPLRAYYMGREERLDDERRNYLREAGNLASQGNVPGAVGAAFRGGDPSTAISISNWDTGRRMQALTMLREGAQRADTPERWAALVSSVERVFGPEMVGNYRDFNSRPAALTALEQAQVQLAQAEAAVKAQQAATAERQARLDEYLFGQFGFGAPSGSATPSAPAPAAQLPDFSQANVLPMPRASGVPGISIATVPGAAPSPGAQPPLAPTVGSPPAVAPVSPPAPADMPNFPLNAQGWPVPPPPQQRPLGVNALGAGRAVGDAIGGVLSAPPLQAPQTPPATLMQAAPPPSVAPAPQPPPSAPSASAAAPPAAVAPAAPVAAQAPASQPQTLADMVAAMSPQNRNAAMLLLMKRDYQGLAKMIEGITPGTETADRKFAEEYAAWTTGGYADVQRQLVQLSGVQQALGSNANITGPVVGSLPDFVNRFINPDALANRQRVEEVVQRSLRQVLGAQFTEPEANRLIARAYDPTMPQAENLRRVNLLLQQIAAGAEARQSASEYFRQNGTLRGWQGRMPSVADFEAAVAPQAPGGPATSATAGTPQGQPPVPGAQLAPDGKWYLSDPSRPGRFLRVDP